MPKSGGGPLDPFALRDPNGDNDKYFNPNAGTDGTGTFANPWNALTSARVASLVAGQGLWCRGGGVSYAWPDTTGAASGTSNNRILVATYHGDTQFEFTFTGVGARLGGGSYWRLQNLKLSCVTTGLCTEQQENFAGGVTSNFIDFIDIAGVQTGGAYTDNQGIIFSTNGWGHRIIRGTWIGPADGATQVGNQSLIWFDWAYGIKIIGGLFERSGNPIYFKHTNWNDPAFPGGIIQNCIIRLGGRGVRAQTNYSQWINSAFDACRLGLDERDGSPIAGGNSSLIRHCTFFNSNALGAAETTDAAVCNNSTGTDNVFAGTSLWIDAPYEATNKNTIVNYSAVEGAATNHYYRNSVQRTIASYKATYPTQEINGVAGTLSLVGGSTPGSTPANWALAAGSVGIGNASDGGDRGVRASRLLTLEGWNP